MIASPVWARRCLRTFGFVVSPLVLLAALAPTAVAKAPIPQLRPVQAELPATIPVAPSIDVSDEVATKLAGWLEVVSGRADLSAATIAAVLAAGPDWPAQTLLRQRYEQAVVRDLAAPDAVIAALAGQMPTTADAALLLARALVGAGRKDDAATFVRDIWRRHSLNGTVEEALLKQFGEALTAADHAARVDHFLHARQISGALRNAKLLDAPHRALVDAQAAVINRAGTAGKLLDQVPEAVRGEPGYILARVQFLRRASKFTEAAALLLTAPTDPGLLGDPDIWSEERRDLARRLIDVGDAATAYRLVAAARATSQTPRVEAEFEAGWYALVFLNEPAAARPHFQAIIDNSSTPISRARGAFWLARVAEAEGNAAEALAQYEQATRYPIAFYGQLAAAKLERNALGAGEPAAVDPAVAARFADRHLVQALVHLQRTGRTDEASLFYRQLATTLVDPAELALLAGLAQQQGRYPLVVQIGKAAQQRGVAVGTLAFPTKALPAYSGKVATPVLYAVARQESEFQQFVVSSAGAVGMFQVMPQFAGEMARRAGITYSASRIRTDAAYNMQIGAAELSYLISMYDGSHVLAFAAYNAGAGRVTQWIKAFGDPRDPAVDVIDWIERIPFGETRNYVQRAMENLGVYRALFGDPALRIEADLRGVPAPIKLASSGSPTGIAQPAAIGVSYAQQPPAAAKPKPPAPTASDPPVMTNEELAARIAAVQVAPTGVAYRLGSDDEQ